MIYPKLEETFAIKGSCIVIGWGHFGPLFKIKNIARYEVCAGNCYITETLFWSIPPK